MKSFPVAIAAVLCLSFWLSAGATPVEAATSPVAEFLAYQDTIRERFENEQPRKLNRNEWARFERAQTVLRSKLEGRTSLDELNDDARLEVFNAQEEIAALIRGEESERVICRRERPTGSNIGVRTCRTIAEINQAREAAMEAFMRLRTPAFPAE